MQNHEHGVVTHIGHERLHTALLILMFAFLILSQAFLYWWKKNYNRSFLNVTLIGLWLIPLALSLYANFIRFVVIWALFSVVTIFFFYVSRFGPLEKNVPKRIYAWFYFIFRISYGAAIVGYLLILADMFTKSFGTGSGDFSVIGALLIFYGLYFGVLGRDFAEVVTDRIAAVVGYTGKGLPSKGIPPHTCCICGLEYDDNTVAIDCGHKFHDWCIRGWTMIGKKNTCPFCGEKVDFKSLMKKPWEKPSVLWVQLMEAIRYLVVWNPIILITIEVVVQWLDPGA